MFRDLPSPPYAEKYCSLSTKSRDMETKNHAYGEIEEICDEVQRRFNHFKNFEVLRRYPTDHHYFTYRSSNDPVKIASWSSFSRRIDQEWKFLDKNTPSSIFIRVYEQMINLMRVAVVGPPQTPYNHCLFFFDIVYPRDYPSSPPQIYYHSYGIDLNPNLRSDGKVCLELLRQNWNKNEDEWNPEEYNVLHLLQSIQDQIFDSKPPDNSKTCLFFSFAKSDQLKCDDMAFLLMCEKMNKILKRPPRDFEDFVPGYFRSRAHHVLLKFKENKYDSEDMIDLFVAMFKLFESTGAYCKHHLDFLKLQKKKSKHHLDFLASQQTKSSAKPKIKALISYFDDY